MLGPEQPQAGPPPKRGFWRRLAGLFNPFNRRDRGLWRAFKALLLLALIYTAVAFPICVYEYQRAFPPFWNPSPAKLKPAPKPGQVFASVLIRLSQNLSRAWLPNDVFYFTIWLDNPQNFQLGQLEALRYASRVLRDKLSRQRTTDKIDPVADRVFVSLSNDPLRFWFPSFESKLKAALKALKDYRQGLAKGSSHFYPRADNLIELLDQMTSLLGGVNTKLANAPRDVGMKLSEETAGDRYSQGEQPVRVRVPWHRIDDNFYFARGVAYALRQILVAVHWEWREIIAIKKSGELLSNVIVELGRANFEPLLVLNGSRDSLFANHSLKLQATLENVRQKLINLQQMLER